MAFRPELFDLLDPRGFARKKEYTDLLDSSSVRRARDLNSDYDEATMGARVDSTRAGAEDARMGTNQRKAIQPGLLAELERENLSMLYPSQGVAAQRPAFGPQPEPAAEPNLPPYYLRPNVQETPAQPQAVDPYSLQQAALDERAAFLDRNRGRTGAIALSPVIAALTKAQGENLAGREDLAGDRATLQGQRDFAAALPDLERIKGAAVQAMRGQSRDKSIDTWNGMITAIQSAAVAKSPTLLQNKGFQEYMSSLEKLKPAPPADIGGANAARQNVAQVISLENTLRDEYEKIAGESRTISRAGQDVAQALKTNNPLSIRTAVTKFAKIADPTTGVLSAEGQATEKAAMGDLLNTITGTLQRAATGEMTPESVENFRKATRDLMRVQKSIFERAQQRTQNRFSTYQSRFPDMPISLDAVMGSQEDRRKEIEAFDAFPEAAGPVKVTDKAAYDALPSGTEYIGPSGKRARKP